MHTHRRHRLAATAVAAGLLATSPAVAAAQDGSAPGTGTAPVSYATPPPLPPGTPVLADSGVPDLKYQLKTQCVRSLNKSFNEGVKLPFIPWGQTRLRIEEAHKFATGRNQLVAVIDTGVNQHPYLGNRLLPGGDYVQEKNKGLEDCDGHGTEVAGIIAASTPSNIGFKGVAPDARILSIRQSSGNYTAKPPPTPGDKDPNERAAGVLKTLSQAVRRATDAGATVINMSVDSCRAAGPITDDEVTLQAALHYAVEHNVVVVSSAGNLSQNNCPAQNNGPDPSQPATIVTPPWFADDVISVAAIEASGDPAQFSVQGPWVTVAAPGTDIISLDPATNGLANRTFIGGTQETPIQGTSFAAPYVSGLVALVRQRYPGLTARQVMNRIEQTAQHPASPGGRDTDVGFGVVDPVAALTTYIPAEEGVAPPGTDHPAGLLPPAPHRDWAPMQVALLGTGGGIGVLLLTMFAVHTVRRNRERAAAPARRS